MIVGLVLIDACGGAWGWYRWIRPTQMFRRAQQLAHTNPIEAERVVQSCIEANGGDYPDAQLLLCQLLGDANRWTEALGCFKLIEDSSDCDPAELIKLARAAEQAQYVYLAEVALEAARRPGDHLPTALQMLITLKFDAGQRNAVTEDCQQLYELDPDDPFPWEMLATIHDERKNYVKAIAAYRNAVTRTMSPLDVIKKRMRIVAILIKTGEAERARHEMDVLLLDGGIEAATPDVRVLHVELLRLEGKTEAAFAEVGRILEREPNSNAALLMRGMLYLDRREFEMAKQDLYRVVSREPYNMQACHKLGMVHLCLNDRAKAQQYLKHSRRFDEVYAAIFKLLRTEPKTPDHLMELTKLYKQIGRFEIADKWRRMALAHP